MTSDAAHTSSPAHRATRRGLARPRKRWLVPAGVVLLALLALFQLFSARRHLLAGAAELRSAAALVRPASQLRDAATRATLRDTLVRANGEFGSARIDLWLWSPLLDRLGWVPRLGGQLAAAFPASDTAYYTTGAALHLMDGLNPIWSVVSNRATSGSRLAVLAPVLAAGNGQFRAAQADAQSAAGALAGIPRHTGNASLDRATAQLSSALPVLQTGTAWLAVAPVVLGLNGPSSYLMLLQNPAELRATGGFIGAYGVVTVSKGTVHSRFASSNVLPREIDSVSPPLPEALYTAEEAWIFRDSNWSPDFPLSARLARWFYGEDTGHWIPGVIAVVDTAFAPILHVTGPVYLPAYHRWVNEADVATVAREYRGLPLRSIVPGADPKQFLGHVIAALMQRIPSLPIDRWPALGSALADDAKGRDILVYDRRPEVHAAIVATGVDGRLQGAPGDYLAVIDDNRSYNKINPYVHESADYQVEVGSDLWLNATLTLRYYVAPSPADLHGVGPAYGLEGSKHDYEDFLRVYVPAGARLVGMSGIDRWAPAPAYGLTQFAGRLLIREGQTRIVTIRYRVPANALAPLGGSRYALTVRRQPGGDLTALHVVVRSGSGVTVGGGSGQTVARTVSLSQDGQLETPLGGKIQARVVSLRAPSGPVDPYIPFLDFHDPRHPL
jgi:Protein of unknown function (DUF4012)